MHGRIDVESVPGEGTTVRVTLPVSFAVLARPQATAVMQAALA
ncbi:MAG: ATP-binding protein [Bacteroidota bacterium]